MSTVTDVIVTCHYGENTAAIEKLDEWLEREGHPPMIRADRLIYDRPRGKAMQLYVWINACNYLDEKEFCRVLWEECPWESPHEVQCFMQEEEIDGVREQRNPTTDQLMRDFIGEWVNIAWNESRKRGFGRPLAVESKTAKLFEQAKALGFFVPEWIEVQRV